MPTRVRRIHKFFIRFEPNLSEYGYYLLHIRMFRYIRRHHLFASFASYSLRNIHTKSYTNIRFDAKQMHVGANICFGANIRFPFSHAGEYSLRNSCFEANIHKTSSEIHIQVNINLQILACERIFACKYSHTSEYLLPIALNYIGIL